MISKRYEGSSGKGRVFYNRVLYSPRGSTSQRQRPSGQSNLYTGEVGATTSREIKRTDRLLQATLRGEWS